MCPKMLSVAVCALLLSSGTHASDASAKTRECPIERNIATRDGGKQMMVTFANQLSLEVHVSWLDFDGNERPSGEIGAFSDMNTNTYEGHAFRLRTKDGALLLEYVARKTGRMSFDTGEAVVITACGNIGDSEPPLYDEGRDKEFEALAHDHSAPCVGPSKNWSCVKYYSREEVALRNRSAYGFQEGEVSPNRVYNTFDKTYTSQIGKIPKITPLGAGYLKMTMTDTLKANLLEWYKLKSTDGKSLVDHGVIAGGYTNNHKLPFDKVDLDRFRSVHSAIVREMQQVLQWWCQMRLRHTSTFGVRVYRRGSMLIDHVDRMDTHLASAVLQVHQVVDEDGGWPLEVLLPHGRVGEVYLQAGEMVLYEGAWLRHGRPMRFKGGEFANIFSHFAPLDWRGPNDSDSPTYYGYVNGRCDTIADDGGVSYCQEDNGKADGGKHAIDLDFGPKVAIPPLGEYKKPKKPFAMTDYSHLPPGAASVATSASMGSSHSEL